MASSLRIAEGIGSTVRMALDQLIHLDRIALRYDGGPEVLRDIDLLLTPGSFHFLTGSSGAGKSSMLRLLSLAQRPSRGKLLLFGRDSASLSRDERAAMRRQIGVVFQDFRLLDHLNVTENVALPLRIAGINQARIRAHVQELLTWVGLGDNLDASPSALSGGEQQRVAIARAVIARPRLLLADEPTGNVDDRIALRLMRLFEELHHSGTTVVVATHNMLLPESFPHPVIHLEEGRIAKREVAA